MEKWEASGYPKLAAIALIGRFGFARADFAVSIRRSVMKVAGDLPVFETNILYKLFSLMFNASAFSFRRNLLCIFALM